ATRPRWGCGGGGGNDAAPTPWRIPMARLADTQLVILSSASRRNDRGVDLPANVTGEAVRKAVDKLIRTGLDDVLELPFAQILERELRGVGDEIAHRARDEDRARLGDVFEPRGDVDSVAKNVAVLLHHHVAEVDADAEFDPLALGDVGVAFRHAVLHVDRAAQRPDRACELGEDAIARGLDEPPLVLG